MVETARKSVLRQKEMQLEAAEVEAGMDKADCAFLEKLIRSCVERETLQGLRKQNFRKQRSSQGPRGTDCSTRSYTQACSELAFVGTDVWAITALGS